MNGDKKKIVLITAIVLFISILLIVLGFVIGRNDEVDLSNYPDGTKLITNSRLQKEKCIDNICISDLHVYYVSKEGSVEFMLENKKDVKTSGYYKIVLGDKQLIVYYEFDGKEKYKSEAGYSDIDLSKAKDYKFEKLTKEDEKKIVK